MNYASVIIHRAQVDGARQAVRMGWRSLSYDELVSVSETLGAGLQSIDVRKGDRVMMYANNSIEHVVLYHALARIGAIFSPVHPEFRSKELEYAISNSKPKLIIADEALLPDLELALQQAGHDSRIMLLGLSETSAGSQKYRHFSELVESEGGCPPIDVEPECPLLISYTSGTSSLPKPVLRSHGSELWSAQAYSAAWGIERNDCLFVAMSLSWVYGLCSLAQTALGVGATVIITEKFSPTRTLELIASGEVSAFAGTTSMYSMMLNIMREEVYDTSSLRKVFLGGEPRNESVINDVEARLGLRLCEGWAMSESFPALAIHPELDMAAPRGSLGRAVPGVEIRLVDEAGNDVKEGEPGEALIRSPGNFICYYREPGLTDERRAGDGWIRSGDLMSRDASGYYNFVTRKSEMIIRGGVNISPAEIESAICEHLDVEDGVVVGLPDNQLGELVVALIVSCKGKSVDVPALRLFLEKRIARFKVPAQIFQVDSIPRGTTGKKSRAKAREVAESIQAEFLTNR